MKTHRTRFDSVADSPDPRTKYLEYRSIICYQISFFFVIRQDFFSIQLFIIFSKELRRESKRLRRELRDGKKAKLVEEVDSKDDENEKEGLYFRN